MWKIFSSERCPESRKTQGGRPVIPAKKKKLGFISKGPTFLGGHLVDRII